VYTAPEEGANRLARLQRESRLLPHTTKTAVTLLASLLAQQTVMSWMSSDRVPSLGRA
jgi:hypothetical protein